jgi:hypothetical protein
VLDARGIRVLSVIILPLAKGLKPIAPSSVESDWCRIEAEEVAGGEKTLARSCIPQRIGSTWPRSIDSRTNLDDGQVS